MANLSVDQSSTAILLYTDIRYHPKKSMKSSDGDNDNGIFEIYQFTLVLRKKSPPPCILRVWLTSLRSRETLIKITPQNVIGSPDNLNDRRPLLLLQSHYCGFNQYLSSRPTMFRHFIKHKWHLFLVNFNDTVNTKVILVTRVCLCTYRASEVLS